MKHLLRFLVVPFLLLMAATAPGQSALDGFDPNTNGGIYIVVRQPDGKVLLGGNFTTLSPNGGAAVTRNRIARLNPDGTLDLAFNPNANGDVRSIALQADGKILVGGFFNGTNSIGGQTRNRIARLDATTGAADSFDPDASGVPFAIAVQADGKILVSGSFSSIGGQSRGRIARLDPTTGAADSFNPNANGVVFTMASQMDGRILVGGDFTSIGGQSRNRIARVDATTGLADSFDPNANAFVTAIEVQADGKILVGGFFNGANSIGGEMRNRIARLDQVTGLADSFNPNATALNGVLSIAVQADGKILAGGDFTSIGGQTRNYLARLDPTTGLADSFDPSADASSTVHSIVVQPDGKVLVGGFFSMLAPNGGAVVTRNGIARLETDGRVDQTVDFGIETSATFDAVFAYAVQPDGKILIGGRFPRVRGVTRHNIARFNIDGTLDMGFDPNADSGVYSIAVQADGKILVGGEFNSVGGQPRKLLARLDAITGLADSFDPSGVGFGIGFPTVRSISVQADGKILVGGAFTTMGGQPRNHIARLDPTNGSADSFDPNASGLNFPSVVSITVQPDGKILVGGAFTIIGGQPRNYLARLDAATGLADSFNPNANGTVYSIAVQADGKILAGGFFHTIGGQTRNYLARLDAMTGLADSFNPNPTTNVDGITLQADGKILVVGDFNGTNSIGGQTRNRIARLDASTGLADSFNPNASDTVDAIAVQADGKILAGGFFQTIGGQPRNRAARLSNDTAALQDLTVTPTTISWKLSGASPSLRRVSFELSTDNLNYAPLGDALLSDSSWNLTGLHLPTEQNIYVRARGFYHTLGSESITESVRNAFLVAPGSLGNISTRLRVLAGDNALIGGMIATGTANKKVIIRAIGPTLTDFGVPGALQDPTLELYQGSTLITSNDDWRQSPQQVEIQNSGFAPGRDAESAIIATLTPNQGYTAIVRGKDGTTGVGVVEAFDLEQGSTSKLGNISTRGFVDVDDNVMIAGLIVSPSNGTSTKVLVRALGPTLGDFGVPGFLGDPTLDLVNSSGTTIRSNDNWKDDPQQRLEIEAANLAPTHDEEAALVETVTPGAYTAIVRGSGRTTGVGLVEVYNIP
ncbi:MAG TPA: hypothetical protein VJU77_17020 [Chthoniobacterales bacterium]|nr:hypothetical protein [Chthoniobacterales bacterium]